MKGDAGSDSQKCVSSVLKTVAPGDPLQSGLKGSYFEYFLPSLDDLSIVEKQPWKNIKALPFTSLITYVLHFNAIGFCLDR